MAPVINHSVVVTIDGVDRTSSLLVDTLQVRTSMSNNTSVCDLVVEEAQGYIPQAWDEVIVTVGGVRIFGGYITTRDVEAVSGGANVRSRWKLTARDWTVLFDKAIVTEQYSELSDNVIAWMLVAQYVYVDGVTLGRSDFTRAGISIGFERTTLRQALAKLAGQVGAAWRVDNDKKFYWFNRYSPPPAAFNIDTVAPNNTTTFAPVAGTVRRSIDDSAAINRVTVFGADLQSTARYEIFAVAQDQTEFELAYKPHSIAKVKCVFINTGTSYMIGNAWIGYDPDAVQADDTDPANASRRRVVICNRENRTVNIVDYAGNGPLAYNSVEVWYYEALQLSLTVNDTDLQDLHEHVFEYQTFQPDIADPIKAENYARTLLNTYGPGRETVTFDVTRYGLAPATMINVYSPTLGINPVILDADVLLQDSGVLFAEDGQNIVLEVHDVNTISEVLSEDATNLLTEDSGNMRLELAEFVGDYIIQEVTYRSVQTPAGQMMMCNVTAGQYQQTLIDAMSRLLGGSGVGQLPSSQLRGRVSDVASDLGEVVAGRAIFTDGGTARFDWDTPNQHTGVVVGLDDSDGTVNPKGAVIIYESGVVTAKLGDMTGMSTVGTVTPSGYGLWTDNGYFQGIVAASTIYGGTVSGGVFSGGTVTGGTLSAAHINGGTINGAVVTGITISGNTITGGTIGGAFIYTDTTGTIRTSINPVNSSNPGVYLDSSGLWGYGTLGLTFKIPTDPADRPVFSSGTILNTIYEVTTASVIRTGTVNPRIQIDNSGIFAYNGAGSTTFTVDVTTGRMTAVDGIFSGSISATRITGGTVSGGVISGGTVTGALVTAGTVSGGVFTGGVTNSGTISAGVISGATVSGGTVSGGYISGGTVSGALVTGANVSGGTVSGGVISGGTVSGALVTAGTVNATVFTSGTISGSLTNNGTISAGVISLAGGSVTLSNASGLRMNRITSWATDPNVVEWDSAGGGFILPWKLRCWRNR